MIAPVETVALLARALPTPAGLARMLWQLEAAVFELSLGLLGAIWLGYPAVVGLWARWRPYRPRLTPLQAPSEQWPTVSVIVSAYNEAAHIAARVRNLWAQQYPTGRLEILVSEDGSTDGTVARVEALAAEPGPFPLRLLSAGQRLGKAAAINRAVEAAWGEIVILTDANNAFAPAAIRHLAAPFADASVGAVIGRKTVAAGAGVGGGESVYWRYEAWLTARESAAGSAVAAYGEALALRRVEFSPLPTHAMVGDDLYPMFRVLARGQRVLAAPEAQSFETAALSDAAEWERRQRMAVGRWGALASLRHQWRRLGWVRAAQVLFHQALRPISALWLALALVAGLGLLAAPAGAVGAAVRALAWTQAAGYLFVAGVGLARWRGWRLGRAEAPYFFCLALAASLEGWWHYLRRRQSPYWERVPRTEPEHARPLPRIGHAAWRRPAREKEGIAGESGISQGRILNGLFWASSSFVLGKLLVFGSIVVLARLLAPQAFGEVALAISTITVLEILGTLGLTSALIFEERDVDAAAGICFWITLGTSAIETGLGWWFAPQVAAFFHEPGLVLMLRALSISLILTALGNTHDTLLRRRLAFRAKLLPDLGQAAAKGGASIILALMGFGAWSLIWGQVLGTAVAAALLWWITPWRPAWRFDAAVAQRMVAYAKHIYLLDGSSVLLSNLDVLTIGRMLSDVWLGFYTLAFRIPEVLLLSVLNVITRVVFPAFSRLQNDSGALRATLLDTARYTALLTLPIAAGLGLLAREVVLSVYGWHWGPSVGVLRVLALYAGLRCLIHHFGDAYKAMGRPDILTRTTLAWWLLLPPDLILGAHWGGIVGVAWGQVTTRTAITGLHMYLVAHFLEVRPADLWRCFAPALEATAVMSAGLLAVHPWVSTWAPRPALVAMILLGMALYAATLELWHPQVVRAVLAKLKNARPAPGGPRETRLPAAPLYSEASTAAGPRA